MIDQRPKKCKNGFRPNSLAKGISINNHPMTTYENHVDNVRQVVLIFYTTYIISLLRALDQFKNFDGKQLLSMKRKDLVTAFGKEEGGRLDGQITICRKTTGFNTASSELRDVLAKAKRRSEKKRKESEIGEQEDNEFHSRA